jgi:hypothetical protein
VQLDALKSHIKLEIFDIKLSEHMFSRAENGRFIGSPIDRINPITTKTTRFACHLNLQTMAITFYRPDSN